MQTTHLHDFLGQLLRLGLLKLGNASRRLGSEKTTAPVATDFIEAIVVVVLDSLNQLGQVQFVVRVHLKQEQKQDFSTKSTMLKKLQSVKAILL